jgi:hypothetical protein
VVDAKDGFAVVGGDAVGLADEWSASLVGISSVVGPSVVCPEDESKL